MKYYPNYKRTRLITTKTVQDAVNEHYKAKVGWPLYPVNKIQEALEYRFWIWPNEVVIEFDSEIEKMVVGIPIDTKDPTKPTLARKIKNKLIEWLR